ncbi:AAA family ATPase [Streptomyces sp. NRRL S-87]|uniref:AAA family ATPase n=1 Tax=Streptomyces sp. NRRL S-87 TaxID=1463920 RepID=UPI0005632E37|nr:biotin transporter BioY [Streptomyces sp. NRRL S-87]
MDATPLRLRPAAAPSPDRPVAAPFPDRPAAAPFPEHPVAAPSPEQPDAGPSAEHPDAGPARPAVTELRLSAYKRHRGAAFPLGPVTLFAGASGTGKSTALEAYARLAALACGRTLAEAFPDAPDCVPDRAVADAQGRRGFRIGCTVDGPVGPVRLDLAVQADPELRVVGERLVAAGQTLLTTALTDPRRPSLQAAWLTGGTAHVTRAPLPDDRLGTALLPLRVAGSTAGQRTVLAAAEQVVVALRAVFACDPQPHRMRAPAAPGTGLLRAGCDNLAEVLRRTRDECATRHAALVRAARTGCAGPVADLRARTLADGRVTAELGRGGVLPGTPLGRLGEGELRFLALALVLLTGPGVLAVDPAAELLPARQALAVLADGLDRGLDGRQTAELLRLALLSCGRGHVRLAGAVGEDGAGARGLAGVSVVDLVA